MLSNYLEIVKNIKNNQHILLIPRVQFNNNDIISLSNKVEINNSLEIKKTLLNYLMDRIGSSTDAYKSIPIINIIFSYGIREGKYTPTFSTPKKDIEYHTFNRGKLPIGLIPNDYGKIISKIGNNYVISLNKNTFITLRVEQNLSNLENHITFVKNGEVLYIWKDKIISNYEGDRKFIRYIGKSIINYNNGEISKFKVLKKTSGIKNKLITKNNNLSTKFITMDCSAGARNYYY